MTIHRPICKIRFHMEAFKGFYGDLVYKLKKIVGSINFSAQFIKIISLHKETVPRRYTSFLWIFCVFVLSCVCYVFLCVCLYVLCGHLLRKGWPLGSRLWCLTVSLSLSHWYPGSGVDLDCIDSWSLHPYLLWEIKFYSNGPGHMTRMASYMEKPSWLMATISHKW